MAGIERWSSVACVESVGRRHVRSTGCRQVCSWDFDSDPLDCKSEARWADVAATRSETTVGTGCTRGVCRGPDRRPEGRDARWNGRTLVHRAAGEDQPGVHWMPAANAWTDVKRSPHMHWSKSGRMSWSVGVSGLMVSSISTRRSWSWSTVR